MKVKEESEKVDLKLNIPITWWQIDEETVETVADFIFGGSKITADGDCSYETKRRLLLGRKVMINLVQLSSVQSLGRVRLFATQLIAARQVSLSITNSWSSLTRQHIKKQRHYFANKGPSSQAYGFSSSHVWMWELDYKESWTLKNWCFWIFGEDSWESLGLQGDQTSPS